jgi:hypothetical protein
LLVFLQQVSVVIKCDRFRWDGQTNRQISMKD